MDDGMRGKEYTMIAEKIKNFGGIYMDNEKIVFDDLIKYGEAYSSSMNDYLYAYDILNDVYYISGRAVERFRIPSSVFDKVMETHEKFVCPDDWKAFQEEFAQILSGKKTHHNMVYRWMDHEGKPIWINCRGDMVFDEDGTMHYLIGCINEIGADPMADNTSGLLRDKVFSALLEKRNGFFHGYILRVGIDEFKKLNERLGTSYGDKIIRGVADCIKECFESGEQVYRIIGDEYLIVNDNGGTAQDGIELYNKIRISIERLLETLHYKAVFTISGGLVSNDGTEKLDYTVMEKKSLFALNYAKELGRNQVYVYEEADYEKFLRERELTRELRTSVTLGYQGFSLNYQPIVELETQKLYAAEALLRFHTSTGEFISPVEFVPLLEKCGLIIPVGRWIMDTAMTMCEECRKFYPEFKISINLSYIQLLKSALVEDFYTILDRHSLSADSIILELTESGYLETSQNVMNIWRNFKEIGVCIAMDDFGTGYSNLKNIGILSPNTVKIDRSFTMQALQNEYEHKLLEHIIDMIHSLNLKVVVEGIETAEELKEISRMKPDYIQGYYYSKPCTSQQFKEKYHIA